MTDFEENGIAMSREQLIEAIRGRRTELAAFHVRSLSVFGSFARDEATEKSDVDLLVEFDQPVGLLNFIRLRRFLEEALGRRVDLATSGSLKERIRERVLAEAVRAA